ncbi:MAG: Second mannosyl transferase [Patescibacteria group bacterium]|nr:Second mannosyl transferase [Patescibacteria group bacterium]
MKVLILITKSNWGGAQRYVYDLAVNLPKDVYEIEVMAGGNGVLIEKLVSAGIKADGSLAIGRDVNPWQDIKAFFSLWSLLWEKKPDVLHINSSKIGGLGALAGRCAGIKKIVFTAHGWAFNENRNIFSKALIKFLHWITIILSHTTISVSEALLLQMKNWPFISNKVHVIHNGIKTEALFSKANARTELIKEKLPKDSLLIGSVGELHHVKGYSYALRGLQGFVENLKNIHPSKKVIYAIIGEGEYRENIEKDIENLGLKDSVMLLGKVPTAFHYFKAFDIFLMPSLSEGLPYVLLEAGLAGLPVIATAVGGIPEIIDDMDSGILIQSSKPKEIQHALEFYMSHKKTQKAYGIALQKKITEQFSLENMVSETSKIYSATNQ